MGSSSSVTFLLIDTRHQGSNIAYSGIFHRLRRRESHSHLLCPTRRLVSDIFRPLQYEILPRQLELSSVSPRIVSSSCVKDRRCSRQLQPGSYLVASIPMCQPLKTNVVLGLCPRPGTADKSNVPRFTGSINKERRWRLFEGKEGVFSFIVPAKRLVIRGRGLGGCRALGQTEWPCKQEQASINKSQSQQRLAGVGCRQVG